MNKKQKAQDLLLAALTNANQLEFLVTTYTPINRAETPMDLMSMVIKDLTGPLTYAWHCLARIYAEAHREQGTDVSYPPVFRGYQPVLGAVMESKKKALEENTALVTIADCLQSAVDGCMIAADAFAPFYSDPAMLAEFRAICETASQGLGSCRATAFGRLVAAGRNRAGAAKTVIAKMGYLGFLPEEILERLQRDSRGEWLDLPQNQGADELPTEEMPGRRFHVGPGKGQHFLEEIYMDGAPLFTIVEGGMTTDDRGCRTIQVLMEDYRADVERKFRITLTFPAVGQHVVTQDGHEIVVMKGLAPRFYRPRLRLEGGKLRKDRLPVYLLEHLMNALERLPGLPSRPGLDPALRGGAQPMRIEKFLNDQLLKAVTRLILSDTDLSQRTAEGKLTPGSGDIVAREEYEVHVREFDPVTGQRRTISERWQKLAQLLEAIAQTNQFDLLTTRKSKPGTLVTRASDRGVAAFIERVNAFAQFIHKKRRVEVREIKDLQELWKPVVPSVRLKGTSLPSSWAKGLTECVVLVADLNANNFPVGDGTWLDQDTVLAFLGALDQLALAKVIVKAKSVVRRDEILTRLAAQGYGLDRIKISEVEEKIEGGLLRTTWVITVTGPIHDVGKIKAAVGPIKGVMTLLPMRVFATRNGVTREVHLCVSETSLLSPKRHGLDAWFYMECADLGITEIDPSWDASRIQAEINARRPAGDDGLSQVTVEQDGEVYELGRCMVGVLPFFRPSQTGLATTRFRSDIRLETHAAIMAGVDPESPRRVHRELASLIRTVKGVRALKRAELPTDESAAWEEMPAELTTAPLVDEELPGYDDSDLPAAEFDDDSDAEQIGY